MLKSEHETPMNQLGKNIISSRIIIFLCAIKFLSKLQTYVAESNKAYFVRRMD